MRIKLTTLFLAVIATTLFVAQPAQADHRHPIFVVGDSISAGVGTPNPETEAFPVDAARDLHRRIRVIGHPGRCLVARGCYYPVPLVDTFRREVLRHAPRGSVVVVELGNNDMSRATDAQLEWAYRKLIRQGRHAGVTVVLGTLTPAGPGMTFNLAQRQRINRWIRKRPHVEFSVALGGREMEQEFNSGDGVHPNVAGARAMGRALADYIRQHDLK